MVEPVRGKVAQVLDSRQLVINVGSSQDVAVDMTFKVVNPKGEQIRDPDTNQILGSIESPKLIVRVIEVQDNLSVATISGANPVITPASLGPFARALMPSRWADHYETLSAETGKVSIGDPVIQVKQRPVD
jgi:hypothetical protein